MSQTAQKAVKRPSDAEIVKTLRPFARYYRQFSRMPIKWLDDTIHVIHSGSPYEAEIKRSDCRRAAEVLDALDSCADALTASAPSESFEQKVDRSIDAVLSQENVSAAEKKFAKASVKFREDMRVALKAAGVEG